MRSLLNRGFYALAPILGGLGRNAAIVTYHSVSNRGTHLSITPSEFERQVAYIAKRYKPLFLSELVERLKKGEDISGRVALTLDDGYADGASEALPILRRYKVPVSIFLIADSIGKTFTDSRGNAYQMLSEAQIKEMRASGLVEFLSHTRSHRTLPSLQSGEFENEIDGARKEIECVLGEPVPKIFAYPKGRISDAARAYLKEKGWAAVSTRPGRVKPGVDLVALPRNDGCVPWDQFRAAFTPASDLLARTR